MPGPAYHTLPGGIQRCPPTLTSGEEMEFLAYRILSLLRDFENSGTDMNNLLLELTRRKLLDQPYIRHAVRVMEALNTANFFAFFHLRKTVPNHGTYLVEMILPRVRLLGLKTLIKGFRPTLDLNFVEAQLGFEYGLRLPPQESGRMHCIPSGEEVYDDTNWGRPRLQGVHVCVGVRIRDNLPNNSKFQF